MGLRQEVESSFGNQSDRLLPNRSSGRLPWFEARFSRRSFNVDAVATGILIAVGIPLKARAQVESPVDIAQDQEQLLSDAVTSWSTAAVKEEALGELFELTGIPLSLGFTDSAGYSKLFQAMLVSLDPSGHPSLRYLLTEMEQNGFDTYNVPPFLGDAAPKKGVFTVIPSDQINQKTAALGRVFGLSLQINGADSFAGYNSFRLGDRNGDTTGLIEYTQGEFKDTIRMAHFASLAVQAGIVPPDMMLAYGELITGGGAETKQIFETLQSGKGKQTEWVLQKAPDSPITPAVQRPDALAHVADTYLPKGNLKRVRINFLPIFEGNEYNGLDFSAGGVGILLTDSLYGPTVGFKTAGIIHDDTLEIYLSPTHEKSLELMKANTEAQDKTNRGLSGYIGGEIAAAGGYNISLEGRVAPEAWVLEIDSLTPAITLVTS